MTKKSAIRILSLVIVVAIGLGVAAGAYFVMTGVSARPEPSGLERRLARTVRDLAIGWHARHETNPVAKTADAVAAGRAHFADHCASCHGNDGSGNTPMGRGLYPRAPDMRAAATQELDDYELFFIIENGIRLTGMPAWGTGTKEGQDDSWRIVHFIRHLPELTEDEIEEMKGLNPKPPAEVRQDIEAERFLRGEAPAPPAPEPSASAGGHAHK
jgi:mono/diheme cytochrome c family protein